MIACPCALVISAGHRGQRIGAGARRGILIKGGTYLEDARLLKAVALDKTGTITEGKPKLVKWQVWGAGEETVQQMAASLAARSDHPVSKRDRPGLDARVQSGKLQGLAWARCQGMVNGVRLMLGNHRLIHEQRTVGPDWRRSWSSTKSKAAR